MDFRTGGKHPYTRFLALLFVVVFLAGVIVVTGASPVWLLALVIAVLPSLLVFVASPF